VPDISILVVSFVIINLYIKDFKFNYVKKYLNVLVDPFYSSDDEFF
jgi:hypothetical protein